MTAALSWLDDGMNPIVVKELRQAVRSRLVAAVLLLFLLAQLGYLGIHLVGGEVDGRLRQVEYQAGRQTFMVLQAILLGTCVLFLPAYTGLRLAAERSEVNLDLLFITTLRPRAIVAGKLAAAMVLAGMMFSACAPFMAFTYFLRGIDLATIFFVVALDFAAVVVAVQLAIFLAVIPVSRVLKTLLGVGGFLGLGAIFGLTLAGTLMLVDHSPAALLEDRHYSVSAALLALVVLAAIGLLFTGSVALLQPAAANRALPVRAFVAVLCPLSGAALAACSRTLNDAGPLLAWLLGMAVLASLGLIVAVNERERWGPRVAQTIPRRGWLRVVAFLFSSGAAGGVLFSVLLFGATALTVQLWQQAFPFRSPGVWNVPPQLITETAAATVLYAYCYALTASVVRRWLLPAWPVGSTWLVLLALLVGASTLPSLLSFVWYYPSWGMHEHFHWLLANPAAAMYEISQAHSSRAGVFWGFAAAWAVLVTILSIPWFAGQVRAFRPFTATATARLPEPQTLTAARGQLEATRTAP